MFEIAALLLIAFTVALVIVPLAKNQTTLEADTDVAFFAEQLRLIDGQLKADGGSNPVLEEERVEVAKRLLKADRISQIPASERPIGRGLKTTFAVCAIIGIPVLASGLYFNFGSFGTPDAPLSEVASKKLQSLPIEQLLARAEAQLEKNPDDLRGWQVVERVYAKQQRKSDQRRALMQIIRIDGETADRLSGLAELQLEENQGVISRQTRRLLEKALRLSPKHIRANYYMSYAEEQEGNFAGAVTRVSGLLSLAEPGSQLEPVIKDRLTQLQKKMVRPDLGPTAEDIESAGNLSNEDRTEFIKSMVQRLAEKTKETPQNKENWPRLLNAYVVLGEFDSAQKTLDRARRQFASDNEMTAFLDQFAERLKQQRSIRQ